MPHSGKQVPDGLVEQMCLRITHRGPDDDGFFSTDEIELGMRRLSVIDIAGGGQPIFNEDRSVCVVQNGEIYNFHELRTGLEKKGHQFRSHTDTEVLVHLYEEHGRDFVDHLNGMFSIALWDDRSKQLVLARDRLGVKPLYYALTEDGLVFGSEIKCLLLHPQVSRRPDHQAIYDYLTLGYIPQPRSAYLDIRKLPPAGRLVARAGQVTIDRYWSVPADVDSSQNRYDAVGQLRDTLGDAVRLRMFSDAPLGAFLSGGIDSSIVVALMAQQSSSPIQTFFIDFDESSHSERDFARAVASRYKTEHHEFAVRPSACEILDDLICSFDEPFGDSSAIPTYYVSKLTRQHVTVALAGDGGDESFGGYNRYRAILRRAEMAHLRRWAGPLARAVAGGIPRTWPAKRYLASLGMTNAEFYMAGTQEREARNLLSPDFLETVERGVQDDLGMDTDNFSNSRDPLQPYSTFDLMWYLPDDILTKVDRMSMSHSLEVRAPFLDYRVVELAARMPAAWKLNRTDTKLIVKEAFASELPDVVLQPRRQGFSVPLSKWFRKELRPLLHDIEHDNSMVEAGILEKQEIGGLVREHLSGVRDRSSQLWRILMLTRWWETRRDFDSVEYEQKAPSIPLPLN